MTATIYFLARESDIFPLFYCIISTAARPGPRDSFLQRDVTITIVTILKHHSHSTSCHEPHEPHTKGSKVTEGTWSLRQSLWLARGHYVNRNGYRVSRQKNKRRLYRHSLEAQERSKKFSL